MKTLADLEADVFKAEDEMLQARRNKDNAETEYKRAEGALHWARQRVRERMQHLTKEG